MAYFSAAPTLCEVTYDRNNEERHTPYRYQCRSATTRIGTGSLSPTFTDTATFSLPSGFNVSYYEYLRTLYDSRISNSTKTSGYHGSGQSPGYMSARNFYGHTAYPASVSVQEGRPKTASPYAQTDGRSSYPHPSSLPMIHHGWGPPNEGEEEASGEGHKSIEERLQWVDALNKWIPEHNQNRPGYLTFVGNAPMVDKLLRETLKKREALRKKANEMLELKRQQQRESSALSEKRNRVRFHTPHYQPKPKPYSPSRREPINVPKDPADHEVTESEVSSHVTQSDVDTARSKPPEVEEEIEAEVEVEGTLTVSIDEVQKKRRESLFAKKKRPSPPPPPTPPRTPTPPPVEEPEIEEAPPEVQTAIGLPVVDIAEPALPDPSTFLKQTTSASKNKRITITTPIVKLNQKLQKGRKFTRDTSYEDELRRQELAEKRKQKQMEMLEKMKTRRNQMGSELGEDDDMPNFEDYGFLAKYCIFNKANIEMYRHTFDAVDMDGRGKLSGIETMIALRGVNHKLTMHEEEYLYRTLWECNVDKETNKIPLDQLCVELRAGGVSQKHENEVREKLRHLPALDLLDFLTYVPLFIMIHESVVDNPLSDVRDK
ncbi:hypothetical protein FSP39_015456 [Pinctada imbricata]|uniref:EF-hand domain-containing protein n=1 Tax=Pinctada imbricata TaxID=66713 RepID=A0AA89C3N2_PINIB|nr:hypothetical protein FSP39_015456 [Pinctada imbricata]